MATPRRLLSFDESAKQTLQTEWGNACALAPTSLDPFVCEFASLEKGVGLRYALLVQLLAKVCDPKLNTLCLKVGSAHKSPNTFSPRRLCAAVVVAFEAEIKGKPFGGSTDPYVSTPLRTRLFLNDNMEGRLPKDRRDWQRLCDFLEEVEKGERDAEEMLRQVICCFCWAWMERHRDPLPVAQSQQKAPLIKATLSFLSTLTFGRRLETVVAAIYLSEAACGATKEVTFSSSNASDVSTGAVGDILVEELLKDLKTVEIKHRALTATDIRHTGEKARTRVQSVEFIVHAKTIIKSGDELAAAAALADLDSTGISVNIRPLTALLDQALNRPARRLAFLKSMEEILDERDQLPWHRALESADPNPQILACIDTVGSAQRVHTPTIGLAE